MFRIRNSSYETAGNLAWLLRVYTDLLKSDGVIRHGTVALCSKFRTTRLLFPLLDIGFSLLIDVDSVKASNFRSKLLGVQRGNGSSNDGVFLSIESALDFGIVYSQYNLRHRNAWQFPPEVCTSSRYRNTVRVVSIRTAALQ